MSEDQPKEPVPTTNESSPAAEHAKMLMKRIAKTRADFTPLEREEAEAHGFWVPSQET